MSARGSEQVTSADHHFSKYFNDDGEGYFLFVKHLWRWPGCACAMAAFFLAAMARASWQLGK